MVNKPLIFAVAKSASNAKGDSSKTKVEFDSVHHSRTAHHRSLPTMLVVASGSTLSLAWSKFAKDCVEI